VPYTAAVSNPNIAIAEFFNRLYLRGVAATTTPPHRQDERSQQTAGSRINRTPWPRWDVIALVVPAVLAQARLPGGDPVLEGRDISQRVEVTRRIDRHH
jgi:hypothetical protein